MIQEVKQDRIPSANAFPVLLISLVLVLIGCGSGTSQPPSSGSNPNPTIITISPSSNLAGSPAFTLTINGTNFVSGSMVNFGGSAPATTFVNSAQLTAAIPAGSVASPGTLAVTVTNPAPGGGISNQVNFIIVNGVNAVPTINFIDPGCAPAGEQLVNSVDNQDQLVVVGLNFVADSVVRWNGTDRATTFDSKNALSAQISASDIASAGTAVVTVFNPAPGGGSSNSLNFDITPGADDPQSITVDPSGKFAYVANTECGIYGFVSMYAINSTTGALASIGPPVSSHDEGADSVTVDPSGKFAYVANSGLFDTSGSVAMYTINATTGALTPMGLLFGVIGPVSIAVDPTGKFAYVANEYGGVPNSVAMFTINATTGALTSIGAIAVQSFAFSVAVDPSGKFAYVATGSGTPGSAGSVSMYTINATTGILASIGTVAAGIEPFSLVVDPSGKFAYVTNTNGNLELAGSVSMYTIDSATGALASIGTIAAGKYPLSVVVDPTGKFAYVANYASNDVSMYTINVTTGALIPIGTIPVGQNPVSIAVHPSGKFAYVANSASNDVSIYSIDAATGDLTLIGTTGT